MTLRIDLEDLREAVRRRRAQRRADQRARQAAGLPTGQPLSARPSLLFGKLLPFTRPPRKDEK